MKVVIATPRVRDQLELAARHARDRELESRSRCLDVRGGQVAGTKNDGLTFRDRQRVLGDDRGVVHVRERDRGGLRAGGERPIEDRDAVGRSRFVPVVDELDVAGRELGLGESRDRNARVRDEFKLAARHARDRELKRGVRRLDVGRGQVACAEDDGLAFVEGQRVLRDDRRVVDVREADRGGERAGRERPVEDRHAVGRGCFVPIVDELDVAGRELRLGEGRDRRARVRDELELAARHAGDRELEGRVRGLDVGRGEVAGAEDNGLAFAEGQRVLGDDRRVVDVREADRGRERPVVSAPSKTETL